MSHEPAAGEIDRGYRFGTTRWSVILRSSGNGADSEIAHDALSHLCRVYWRPIFAFVCRRGHSVADAQDLTQEFFVTLLEGNLLERADPSRGRFRSLLLTALQNFLIDAHDKKTAVKRGGAMKFVSWDDWMADAPSYVSLPMQSVDAWPAERVFDVRWAAAIVEQALRRLREECESRGRGRVFDALSGALAAERADTSYSQLGGQLGISEAALKRLLHQLRQRYRALLREEVAQTVGTEAELDDEIRYLCATLASAAR